ncbi:MAG: NUDIX hydrolase [Clostridia bacterium]|nr:NUDIX hydrolase [Clostridia bacterium]
MKHFEKTVESEDKFVGRVIHVKLDKVELEDGSQSMREIVAHPGGVAVAALTENNELLFVRQFRYPYKEVLLELPAGKLEKGMDPLENGKRELLEETGAIGRQYMTLGKLYPSPGYCGEIIHLYFCRIDHYDQQRLDEGEFLDVLRIPLDKAVQMVLNGELPDAKTQTAVLKVAMLMSTPTPEL